MRKTNTELVLRMQEGDMHAFDTLYWEYHQAVYRNILKFTKDPIAAEDILQEVFIRLWEKRQAIDTGQSVAGWLFVISFNLSVNYTRKRLREQTVHALLQHEGASGSDVLTTESDNYEAQYNLIEKAIEQLTPQKRKIVTLCKLEGKTYDEAAAELHISRNTVKEHLSIAMASVNEYVRKHGAHGSIAALILFLNA